MEKYTTITTEEQYDRYMKRFGELFLTTPGTPAYAESTVLGELIKAYENLHFPINPPDKEEAQQHREEQRGSIVTADNYLSCIRTLSECVNISPDHENYGSIKALHEAIVKYEMANVVGGKSHTVKVFEYNRKCYERSSGKVVDKMVPMASNKTLKQYYAGLAMQGILSHRQPGINTLLDEVDKISTMMVEKFGTK